ncbi:MAG: hypothetical protein U9Q68_02325 [Euryarchaeota archaeon]|nr:hypothetical protein [Euryarchaeota archaeon]
MDANEPVKTSTPEPRRVIRWLVEALDLTRFHPNNPIGELLDGF